MSSAQVEQLANSPPLARLAALGSGSRSGWPHRSHLADEASLHPVSQRERRIPQCRQPSPLRPDTVQSWFSATTGASKSTVPNASGRARSPAPSASDCRSPIRPRRRPSFGTTQTRLHRATSTRTVPGPENGTQVRQVCSDCRELRSRPLRSKSPDGRYCLAPSMRRAENGRGIEAVIWPDRAGFSRRSPYA